MDRAKEKEYVTHGDLKILKVEIKDEIRTGDDAIRNEMKNLDERVDSLTTVITKVEANTANSERYMKELVLLQRENNKEHKETHEKLIEKIDNANDKANKNEAEIIVLKQGISDKTKDKAALMTLIGTLGTGLLGVLGIIAKALLT